MPKNSLVEVHNMLLEQMERLAQAETEEEIDQACKVAHCMEKVAKVVVANAGIMLRAQEVSLEYTGDNPGGIFAIEHKE